MSEKRLKRLRDALMGNMREFFSEQDKIKDLRNLGDVDAVMGVVTNVMKLDDILYEICNLGVSGAKIRGVSPEEIKGLKKELEEVSKELRNNAASGDYSKALFLISQFQLLQRRIIKAVANMLSPDPLYEFSELTKTPIISKNIFIVHGRDDKPKLELVRILEKLGLNPIILSEQPDKGRTIIKKLEQETFDVGYAFVILTPDDLGGLIEDIERESTKGVELLRAGIELREVSKYVDVFKDRSRQNVILELGYFIGKIGRNRVCCLYKGKIELPSDIHGVLFKRFNESVTECYKDIVEELKAAGFDIKV